MATITGNDLNNVLTGTEYEDLMIGGAGNDLIGGGTGNDLLYGGNDNDILFGGGDNDYLFGQNGDDCLYGQEGNDTMDGGAGNDTYYVNDAGDSVAEAEGAGVDTVCSSLGYTLGAAVENLTLMGANNINGMGNTLNNVLYGNSGNNILNGLGGSDTMDGGAGNDRYYVDSLGDKVSEASGAGVDTVFSTVPFTLGANVENLILTGGVNSNGTGNALNNALTGNTGNNRLNGLGGTDTMSGGAGNDSYFVDSTGDQVNETVGAGIDTVNSSLPSYTLGANVENLILTGAGNSNGSGNALNNVLTGNSGNNRLNGLAGNDTMSGGTGNDLYILDSTGDRVSEAAGAGVDTVQTSLLSYTLGANVENLTFTGSGNFRGVGNSMNNSITGGNGNDMLFGNNGDDTFSGGLGNDTLFGGLGNDLFWINSAQDVVSEGLNAGMDEVNALLSHTLSANVEILTLLGTANLDGTGNSVDNILAGNSGNNGLNGLAGNDILQGEAGNDILNGGNGNDFLLGGAGADVYSFTGGFGHDWIAADGSNPNSQDKVAFGSLSHGQVTWALSGIDLIVSYGSANDATIEAWNLSAAERLNRFQFSDGVYSVNVGGSGWKAIV